MDQFGDSGDRREISADNRSRGQGVHHAALEDQVNVHQPVTEDGVAKSQRKIPSDSTETFMASVGNAPVR